MRKVDPKYGKNLRKIRIKLALNQSEFAKKLQISFGMVSEYEHSNYPINPKTVKKIIKLASKEGIEVKFEDLRPEE